MPVTVRVEDGNGTGEGAGGGAGRVIRKEATGDADIARLRHEAEILAAARHPGVVEVLANGNDPALLTMANAGSISLDACPGLAIEEVAGLLAALAETVADLHEMGIVHGRIEPSHVILGPDGRPILCGFAGGGFAGGDGRLCAADDVLALGALLRDLACNGAADLEPIPERRWFERVRPWRGHVNRTLLTLAERACAEEADRRLTARQLAAAVRQAVPEARLPQPPDAADPYARLRSGRNGPDIEANRPGPLPWAAASAGAVLLVIGLTILGRGGGSSNAAPQAMARVPAASTAAPESRKRAEVPVIVGDGVVRVGDTRFAVGSPGDVLTIGDWDCDGASTVAVLRPSSGSVFAFEGWATESAALDAKPVAKVEGAIALRAERGSQGCERLVAVRADGSSIEVLG